MPATATRESNAVVAQRLERYLSSRRSSIDCSHLTWRGPGRVSFSDTSARGPSSGGRSAPSRIDDQRTVADRRKIKLRPGEDRAVAVAGSNDHYAVAQVEPIFVDRLGAFEHIAEQATGIASLDVRDHARAICRADDAHVFDPLNRELFEVFDRQCERVLDVAAHRQCSRTRPLCLRGDGEYCGAQRRGSEPRDAAGEGRGTH